MADTDEYLLGRSGHEQKRLIRQAALVEHETEDFLRRAGLAAGMHVFDMASGSGDVAMLAGRLVRPGGSVLGVERSPESLALARRRIEAVGELDVQLEAADLETYEPRQRFDALIGRFIMPYLRDPAVTLRRLSRSIRPGGVVALVEFDVRRMDANPHSALFQQVIDWIVGAFAGGGVDPGLGSNLGALFSDAGLPWPHVMSFQAASCGPKGPLWLFSDLVQTLLPQIERLKLATAAEVEIDTLLERLRAEAIEKKITAFLPRWVGAWVRLPPDELAVLGLAR